MNDIVSNTWTSLSSEELGEGLSIFRVTPTNAAQ